MAIDPKLVSIIPASQLPTGDPTNAADFLFYEGDALKKGSMSNIYDRVSSGLNLGFITPSSPAAPITGIHRGQAAEAGTYTNFKDAANASIVVTAADLDIVNGAANYRVIIEVKDGVASKYRERVKGDTGAAADPSKLPIYNPANSYAASVQFIYDNVIYKVMEGQILRPNENPKDFILTKLDIVGKEIKVSETLTPATITVVNGSFINTSVSPVNLTPTVSGSYSHTVKNVNEGEIYEVIGSGGSGPRLWAYIDASNNILSSAAASVVATTALRITAPMNAVKMIINSSTVMTVNKVTRTPVSGESIFQSGAFQKGSIISDDYYISLDFNGSLTDKSGNGFHGVGTVTYGSGRKGVANSAVNFAGTGINLAKIPVITETSTMSFWLKTSATAATSIVELTQGANEANRNAFAILLNSSNQDKISVVNNQNGVLNLFKSSVVVNDNLWHHVVVQIDRTQPGNKQIKIYIDGVLDAGTYTLTNVTAGPFQLATLYVGARGLTNSPLIGLMDELYIYNRILQKTEITNIYNS